MMSVTMQNARPMKTGLALRVAGKLWHIVRFLLFRWSPSSFRNLQLRIFGAQVGRRARIDRTVRIEYPWNLRVGASSVISHDVIIECMGVVSIGRRVLVSQYAHLCAGTHDYQEEPTRILGCPIYIEDDVWIATDAFVGPGARVGERAMLSARSSVFGELPAGMICMGEPARPVKARGMGPS